MRACWKKRHLCEVQSGAGRWGGGLERISTLSCQTFFEVFGADLVAVFDEHLGHTCGRPDVCRWLQGATDVLASGRLNVGGTGGKDAGMNICLII